MKRTALLALGVVFATVGVVSAQERVSLCGTGESQELLRTIGAAFEKTNPGVSIEVPDSVGDDGGIKAAAAGECDFGRIARPLTEQEKNLKLTYRVFAFLPVMFVVDPAAGIENLRSKQIVGIYSGTTVGWEEVGGKRGKIAVVNLGANDPSRGEVNKRVKGFKGIENPVGVVVATTTEAVDLLSKTPGAIGYLPGSMAKGSKLKVVGVDGVGPTATDVVQGVYRIGLPFGLVWKGKHTPAAKRFYQFLKGPEGRKIIKKYGTIPLDHL